MIMMPPNNEGILSRVARADDEHFVVLTINYPIIRVLEIIM